MAVFWKLICQMPVSTFLFVVILTFRLLSIFAAKVAWRWGKRNGKQAEDLSPLVFRLFSLPPPMECGP